MIRRSTTYGRPPKGVLEDDGADRGISRRVRQSDGSSNSSRPVDNQGHLWHARRKDPLIGTHDGKGECTVKKTNPKGSRAASVGETRRRVLLGPSLALCAGGRART